MIAAFKERRPWAAVLVTLIFGPFISMLYLSRGLYAVLYLIGAIACIAAALVLGLSDWQGSVLTLADLAILPLRLIGSVHAVYVARAVAGHRPKLYARWYSVVAIWSAFLVAALLIHTFVVRPFDARSVSMSPTINTGDYFLASRLAYVVAAPQRGDLAVFYVPRSSAIFVKRIIGLPGDKIQMKNGVLYINGAAVGMHRVEDYLLQCGQENCAASQFEETLPNGRSYRVLDIIDAGPSDDTDVYSVPPDHYFVLGDNRDNSEDSRHFGSISSDAIIGMAWIKLADKRHPGLVFQRLR